jgi:4-hydroxy-tetrahydrodipicolinate reductase
VCLDFSRPELAQAHIERYARLNLRAVVGTTGWYDEIDRVQDWVRDGEGALLYAPNFSIGVALLARLVEAAGAMVDRLPEYDVYVQEVHHRMKLDSPSGTALHLGQVLIDRLSRKTRLETETQHKRIDPSALHVTSTRAGQVFGHHIVSFDSAYDHIEISHQARNRAGFADGALRASEWLAGKCGLYTLDDPLADWFA